MKRWPLVRTWIALSALTSQGWGRDTGADTQIRTVLYGAPVTTSVTATTADTSGRLDIFAQATRFFISSRATHTLASYTGSAPATVNLLGPLSSVLF